MGTYIPPGWPAGVHPPGSEEFESTAVGWLLDVVPPDYRLHGVLRRYPVALATMARYHSKACVEGARQGYRTARTELAGALPPHAIDTVLAAYRKEGARLAATARAVDLVERALRGEVFTPKMSPPPAGPRQDRRSAGAPGARGRRRRSGETRPGRKAAEQRAPRHGRGRRRSGREPGEAKARRQAEAGRRRRQAEEEGGPGRRRRREAARAGSAGRAGGAAEFGRPREERPGPDVRR